MSAAAREFLKQNGLTASIMSDGTASAELIGWIDTGCYMLNALCSGSIFGGVPSNRISIFGGEPATGKTFFMLALMRHFHAIHPEAVIALFDTEAAITKEMLAERGIIPERVMVYEPDSIEKFRTDSMKLIDSYLKLPEKKRFPMMMVLDSLSSLYTDKEKKESEANSGTRDMTKPSLIRSTFHILTRTYLAQAGVPLLITNHVHNSMNPYGESQVFSGGLGAMYAASTVIQLSKKKDTDKKTNEVVGNIITARAKKSRLGRENQKVDVRLGYKTGLDRYYGLMDLGGKHGVFARSNAHWVLPDGSKQYESAIYADPTRFFTEEILMRLDEAAAKDYKYGPGLPDITDGATSGEAGVGASPAGG